MEVSSGRSRSLLCQQKLGTDWNQIFPQKLQNTKTRQLQLELESLFWRPELEDYALLCYNPPTPWHSLGEAIENKENTECFAQPPPGGKESNKQFTMIFFLFLKWNTFLINTNILDKIKCS